MQKWPPVRAQRSRRAGGSRVDVDQNGARRRGRAGHPWPRVPLLEGEGYLVDGAADGREALTKLTEQPPDALVVDLDLPLLNGCDLVRVCRADAGLRHLPIIAISGMVGGHAVRDLDVQGFLPKPFSLDTLITFLHGVLRQDTTL